MRMHVETLRGLIESLLESAAAKEVVSKFNRACQYKQGKAERKIEVNEKVLVRIPGIVAKLEESWSDPWVIIEKLSRKNVRVALCENVRRELSISIT